MARMNRRDVFDPNEVMVLHCVQRTVRRAWLCGQDPLSGKSFEHRRIWIQDRLQELSANFGIDCLSFAVMVNHIHVILRNRPDVVGTWSDWANFRGHPSNLLTGGLAFVRTVSLSSFVVP